MVISGCMIDEYPLFLFPFVQVHEISRDYLESIPCQSDLDGAWLLFNLSVADVSRTLDTAFCLDKIL